ncbi:MAG: hypothetical protein ACRYFZ_10690 [Janthinobacterium lividum]
MLIINQEAFLTSLKITQAYCAQQLQQLWQSEFLVLRTSLQPVYQNQQWFVTPPGMTGEATMIKLQEWLDTNDPYDPAPFAQTFAQQLAHKTNAVAGLPRQAVYPGRILVIEYGLNIPDGAVEVETSSFFDEYDLAPLDTWFYNGYSEAKGGILFAWIPAQFVDLAQLAIDIQFLNILHWFVTPPEWVSDPYA